MTAMQQIVVGVFDDRSQAEQAINELLNNGFSSDQIRFSGHGASTGGILDSLKAMGFETPFYKHVRQASEIAEVTREIDAQRDGLPYDTDGVVFTINQLALHAELGATSHHPRPHHHGTGAPAVRALPPPNGP